jgi:hypothetical protein
MVDYLEIESARYVENYKLELKFDDGKINVVDFENFILKSGHPEIKKYQDKNLFKNFNLTYGELEWGDYDLVFPIADLYEKKEL